jgi:hypothetical protein
MLAFSRLPRADSPAAQQGSRPTCCLPQSAQPRARPMQPSANLIKTDPPTNRTTQLAQAQSKEETMAAFPDPPFAEVIKSVPFFTTLGARARASSGSCLVCWESLCSWKACFAPHLQYACSRQQPLVRRAVG